MFVERLEPIWITAPLMALGCGALYWRRRYPILVGIAIVSMAILQAPVGMSLHTAVGPVVGIFFVSWAIGAYETRSRAVLGLAIILGGLWVSMAVDSARGTDHYVGTDYPWLGAILLLPGVCGIAFGARTRSLRAAETRAKELELERREAIAAERARIARELHDVIAHSVSVMTVQAGAAEEMLKHDPARALAPVQAVQDTGRQALVEMKRLVGVLKDVGDDDDRAPQPRLADLDELAAKLRDAGQRVEVRVEGEPRDLPLGVELSAYRVVQEALTNTLKHAGGAPVVATLRYGADELAIDVSDEGRAQRESSGGHGLAGMRERVGIFGGTFHAGPRDGGGFSFTPCCRSNRPHDLGPARRRPGACARWLPADPRRSGRPGGGRRGRGRPGGDRALPGTAAGGRPDGRPHAGRRRDRGDAHVVAEALASHVLVLTTFDEDRVVYDALAAGASGFLLKTEPPARLVDAVRTVAGGEALLAPTLTRRLIAEFVRRPPPGDAVPDRLAELTAREREVLALIGGGFSNAEIASSLVVSGATVKTHVNRIFSKLDLRDRVQAVVLAYETGLVRPGQ